MHVPIVPIMKADSSVRICRDNKLTVNHAAEFESYPLSRIEDLVCILHRAFFSESWMVFYLIFRGCLIMEKETKSHLEHLDTVLKRLYSSSLRLKKEKCAFLQVSVVYLVHKIDVTGLHTVDDKVEAVMDVTSHTNVKDLQCYLGLIS